MFMHVLQLYLIFFPLFMAVICFRSVIRLLPLMHWPTFLTHWNRAYICYGRYLMPLYVAGFSTPHSGLILFRVSGYSKTCCMLKNTWLENSSGKGIYWEGVNIMIEYVRELLRKLLSLSIAYHSICEYKVESIYLHRELLWCQAHVNRLMQSWKVSFDLMSLHLKFLGILDILAFRLKRK